MAQGFDSIRRRTGVAQRHTALRYRANEARLKPRSTANSDGRGDEPAERRERAGRQRRVHDRNMSPRSRMSDDSVQRLGRPQQMQGVRLAGVLSRLCDNWVHCRRH